MTSELRPMELVGDRGIEFVRGAGVHLFDPSGRAYLDMMSNYGVNVLGHAHPDVTAAIHRQSSLLLSAHQSVANPARNAFIDALGAVLPPELNRVCFANSGSETLDAAWKFSRVATGKHGVVAMHRGFHGKTLGALALTADKRYREPFLPMLEGVVHIPFDDIDAAHRAVDDTIGAVVVEPIQGEAGIRIPSDGYLAALRALCSRRGVILIFDEVQTAFRTGAVLASAREGVVPDVLCLSKGLANGVPFGVVVTTEEVASAIPRGSHSSTFAGNPIACAAGTATLNRLADSALHHEVTRLGNDLMSQVRALNSPLVREVRGRGLMVAVELRRPATPVIRSLQASGVIALPAGTTTIRFLPSLLVRDEHIATTVSALGRAFIEAVTPAS